METAFKDQIRRNDRPPIVLRAYYFQDEERAEIEELEAANAVFQTSGLKGVVRRVRNIVLIPVSIPYNLPNN